MEPHYSAIDRALAELNLLITKLQNDSSSLANESKSTLEGKQTTQTSSSGTPPSAIPAVALTVPRPGTSAPPSRPASAPNGDGSGGTAKATKSKPGKGAAAVPANTNEAETNFEKSSLQVAVISSIEAHPDSEKLFVCQVDVGAGTTCQVVTGLQKFYRAEELRGRQVAVIRNLKPAKLAGSVSEAMILAGAVHKEDGTETVKVLEVPAGAAVGDRIYLQGGAASDSPPKQLSSKVWEKIVALLKVKGGEATFDGKPLVTSAGVVTVPDLPDGARIH